MNFVGIVAIDGGGNDLNSFNTKGMSFSEAAEWYSKAVEYARSHVKHTPHIIEARVMMYDESEIHSITAQPLDGIMFRRANGKVRELVVRPMNY
ncbi:hypothetical protein [Streptomyces anandii]|uniref:hypothetical protein n=1 Tax=Streptomyces anandii TaxID=285454 RepID=UPI0036AC3A56